MGNASASLPEQNSRTSVTSEENEYNQSGNAGLAGTGLTRTFPNDSTARSGDRLKLSRLSQFTRDHLREPTLLARAPASSFLRYAHRLVRILSDGGDTIYIAAVPKSASSFLLESLSAVTGYPITDLTWGNERQEQDLYYPRLVDSYSRGTVTRHHTRATRPNLKLMRRFKIRPVVLVRNFFDVVPSTLDHLYKEGFEHFPCFYCNERFPELDERTQTDSIIEMALPWFFSFYVSWFDACAKGEIDALWITFEEMVSDWPATLQKVLGFHGIEKSDTQVEAALERTRKLAYERIRVNDGRLGRGKAVLSREQSRKILDMARFYPWVDFSRVGIPSRNG